MMISAAVSSEEDDNEGKETRTSTHHESTLSPELFFWNNYGIATPGDIIRFEWRSASMPSIRHPADPL